MSELKPCPFCGQTEIVTKQSYESVLNGNLFAAVCVKCGCRSGHHDSIPAMVAQWNRRTPDADLLAALKEFEAMFIDTKLYPTPESITEGLRKFLPLARDAIKYVQKLSC